MTENNMNEPQESILENNYDDVRVIEMEGYEIGVRRARNVLYIAAGLTLLSMVLSYFVITNQGLEPLPIFWIIFITPILIYSACAFYTVRKPYISVLVGFITFIGFWIFGIVFFGVENIISGIIAKVIILYYLWNGLRDAKKLEDLRKEM